MTERVLTPDELEALYRRYGGLVRRRVARFYGGEEVHDVVQEVFERVARTGHSFRGDAQRSSWLYQVTTRHCLNRLRNARRRKELFDGVDTTGLQPTALASPEARTLLGELWRQLDPDLVQVGIHYHVDGMTQSDIGALFGVSDRTISTWLSKLTAAARAASGEAE